MSEAQSHSRYVVLHHTGWGEEHFDLMIESSPAAAKLLTWQSAVWPLVEGTRLTELGEHRREYLEYEGAVSGGRGEVRRIAEGTCAVASAHRLVRVRFDGGDEWLLGTIARRV